jgi:hypothetical protein
MQEDQGNTLMKKSVFFPEWYSLSLYIDKPWHLKNPLHSLTHALHSSGHESRGRI